MKTYALILSVLCLHDIPLLNAQKVEHLWNGSFEDIPRMGGVSFPKPIDGWRDFGRFPDQSPVDIHGLNTNFWEVSTEPYHLASFLGLVTRPDGSYEGLIQKLRSPLMQDSAYVLSVFLCSHPGYKSFVKDSKSALSFNQPTVMRIWGSHNGDYDELLAKSLPVLHSEWQEYSLDMYPADTYEFLIIEAYYAFDQIPGPGNILIDNARLTNKSPDR